jgi:hypothetical protein
MMQFVGVCTHAVKKLGFLIERANPVSKWSFILQYGTVTLASRQKSDRMGEEITGDKIMGEAKFRNLKRPRYPMPDFIRKALVEHGLMEAYRDRPAYQQNDYLGWITRAKRQKTIEKRLAQMLDELERGNVYMKMDYRPKGPPKP